MWNSSINKETDKFIYKINRRNQFLKDFAANNQIETKVINELFKVILNLFKDEEKNKDP